MPKMNGKKIPYPDAEKRMGGGSLSYGKMRMGGGGVAEDIAAAGVAGAIGGALGGAAGAGARVSGAKRAKIKEGSTRGPNPSELEGREKEEQEEYLRRLEEANKPSKAKEKKGMGGSIARGSGAARAQQFRKNG